MKIEETKVTEELDRYAGGCANCNAGYYVSYPNAKQLILKFYNEGKTYNMSDAMRGDTKVKSVEEIMAEGIKVAIQEFEYIVRGSEGEVTNLFIRKVRDGLNNLL